MSEHHIMEELMTDVEVLIDTSELDEIIETFGSLGASSEVSNLFKPLVDMASDIKKGVESGAKDGAKKVGERLKSLQEMYIALNGSIVSGDLLSSIKNRKLDEYRWRIGTDIAHFYPLTIEFGRGPVRPVNKPFLQFKIGDQWIRTKFVRDTYTTHTPFVEPAFNVVVEEAEEIVWMAIGNATD